MTDTANVFISHIHEDDGKLGDLKELLAKNGCTVRDSSVNSSNPNQARDPDYIMRGILGPRIEWAGTVIVLISPGTHEHPWIDREIEYAASLNKRIVGVWDFGSKDSDLPAKFEDYGSALVGWQGERIIDAVFGRINNWESTTGELRPEREIPRHVC